VTDTNQAIQGLLDSESLGSVVTVVTGPRLGEKAVVDSDGMIVAGSIPDGIRSDVPRTPSLSWDTSNTAPWNMANTRCSSRPSHLHRTC
jgi:hypothetical protein